jgi:hypothetical protein
VSLRSKICDVIHSRPGVTELEIARLVYGPAVDQGQVNRICRQLVEQGYVLRHGRGGPHDPYTYAWIATGPRLAAAGRLCCASATAAFHVRTCKSSRHQSDRRRL